MIPPESNSSGGYDKTATKRVAGDAVMAHGGDRRPGIRPHTCPWRDLTPETLSDRHAILAMWRVAAVKRVNAALQRIFGMRDCRASLAKAQLFPLAPQMPVSGHDLDLERRR